MVWNRILNTNLLIFTVIRIPNPESESSQEFRPNPNPESGIRKLTKVRILRFGMRILRFVKLCWFGSKLAQMRFTINKCVEFSSFLPFFWKIRKNSDRKFENRKFLFKFPLLQRSFFREFFFPWNFAHLNFRTIKFAEFWNIGDFFCKIWKKSDFKFEIW